jgi:exosortase
MSRIRVSHLTARYQWTWPHILGALLLAGAGVLITRDAWADILNIASRDEESSQVWLVPLVVAWLVWVRRGRLRKCRPTGTLLGPVLVALGWFLSRLGFYNQIQAAWHLGAVLVPLGAALSLVGRDLIRRFLPAFAVLVFLVPIPGAIRHRIAAPMMTTTARITEEVSNVLGVPVDRSGNRLTINGCDVNVAEACNGLRMVFSLFLVSYAFAFGEPLRNYVRLVILLASPVSAIVCNVIRMVPTIWMFGYGGSLARFLGVRPGPGEGLEAVGRRLAEGFHDISGWIMLFVGFVLLTAIVRILRWALLPVRHYTLASE